MSDGTRPDPCEPILGRLDAEIQFYEAHQARCRFYHRLFKVLEVIAAALIPFTLSLPASFGGDWGAKGVAAFLGVAVVVMQGVQGVFQFHETWLRHKRTWIALEGEKSLYLAKAAPYDGGDACAVLAARVQSLVANEVGEFIKTQQPPPRSGGPG